MSKRAEKAALEAYPFIPLPQYDLRDENPTDGNKIHRRIFLEGYEQAEKDTIQKALDWLGAHTKSYAGPIEEPFWTMFIEHFKKAMEEG